MSTKVAELVASLRLDAKEFSQGVKEAESKLTDFGKKATKTGRKLTMAVTLPMAGAAAGAIKAASDFETSMTKIQSMVGLSADTVQGFEKDVLRLSGETAQAPKELADAMFFITSAGLRGATAVEALEASAKAAAVGMGDAEVVADAVTNAINGYGSANINAAQATDILAKTVEQGKASAEDLAPQFGRLIPMAAELGIEFGQVGGGLAFLTRASGNASQSTSSLRGILRTLIKPSQMARETLSDVGLSIEDIRESADQDLLGALMHMRATLEANGAEMSKVFEDSEALAGALQLTGQAAGEAAGVMDEMTRAAGTLDRGMEAVQETSGFKMKQAMTDFKVVMIELGDKLIPVVVPLIQKLAKFVGDLSDRFENLSPTMKKVVASFAGFAVAAGPALMAIGSMSRGLGALSKMGKGVTGVLTGGGKVGGSGLLKTLGKLGPALKTPHGAAIALAGVGLAIGFKKWRDRGKEAQERMETLRAELAASGDESALFAGTVEGLTERLEALAEATKETTEDGFEKFNGSQALLANVIDQDVRPAFTKYITDLEHHQEAIRKGSDEYENLQDALTNSAFTLEMQQNLVRENSALFGDNADAIVEAVDAGELEISTLKKMLDAIDETADAHDDMIKENDKLAKKWLENEKNIINYVTALDEATIQEIEALEKKGEYTEAVTLAIDAIAEAEQAQIKEAEAAAKAAAEAERVAEEFQNARFGVSEFSGAVDDSTDSLVVGATALKNYSTEASTLSEILSDPAAGLDSATKSFLDAANASMTLGGGVKSGIFDNTEKLMDMTIKMNKEADDRITAEENLKDSLAEQKVLLDEQNRIRREATKMVKAMESAQNNVKSALKDQKQAEQEIADIQLDIEDNAAQQLVNLAEIETINARILELQTQSNNESFKSAEFVSAVTHEWDKQRLAVMNLEEKIAKLQAEATAEPPDTAGANALIAEKKAEIKVIEGVIAEVNDAEQALIDLDLITEEYAKGSDVGIEEAQQLVRLETQLRETEQAFEDGEATILDVLQAEDRLNRVTDGLGQSFDGLRKAENELADAQEALSKLQEEGRKIEEAKAKTQLELKIATEDLRLATKIQSEEELMAIKVGEEKAKLDEQIAGLVEDKTAVEEKNAELAAQRIILDSALVGATQAKKDADEKLYFAQLQLAEVMKEVNRLAEEEESIFTKIKDLIHAVTGEFRELKDLLKDGFITPDAGGSGIDITANPSGDPTITIPSGAPSVPSAPSDADLLAEAVAAGGGDWLRHLATLDPEEMKEMTNAYHAVERLQGGGGRSFGGTSPVTVSINVEGSVVSENDLLNTINRGLQQKIVSSGDQFTNIGASVDYSS
ncbi:MAG: phage tail tape measure protein [Rhodobacteraceae bacterium]|nr:phage tail tape measure protein [Paracoccaceae bacterium]